MTLYVHDVLYVEWCWSQWIDHEFSRFPTCLGLCTHWRDHISTLQSRWCELLRLQQQGVRLEHWFVGCAFLLLLDLTEIQRDIHLFACLLWCSVLYSLVLLCSIEDRAHTICPNCTMLLFSCLSLCLSGTSPQSPWKTLKEAAGVTLVEGDSLLLRCGDVWVNESLVIERALHATVSSYQDAQQMQGLAPHIYFFEYFFITIFLLFLFFLKLHVSPMYMYLCNCHRTWNGRIGVRRGWILSPARDPPLSGHHR